MRSNCKFFGQQVKESTMTFVYSRTVYLNDTDAAGVVYFASAMQMCHEAYEESLVAAKINLQELITEGKIAIPITHAEIDFFRPLFCGDRLKIQLTANQLKDSEFAIAYYIYSISKPNKIAIKANTKHVCISPQTRTRIPLPEIFLQWINDK